MFNFIKALKFDNDAIAKLLKTTPEALKAFEAKYAEYVLHEKSDNLFSVNAKQVAELHEGINNTEIVGNITNQISVDDIINRIVNELLEGTPIWSFDGNIVKSYNYVADKIDKYVTQEEILELPENLRPQLTGKLMKIDINEPSYKGLLYNYQRYLSEKSKSKKLQWYHMFRQGLDILDLDEITYEIIGKNKNSMGYWLPKVVNAVTKQGFLKVPNTTIIKVPMTMLQLTRCDYNNLTRTTLDIVDKYCQKVFNLDTNKDYFIKTGTYSSKFDFRNAHVHGAKEVRELGEYLLFIHFQACMMASPLTKPCTYGVSTTNEWVVREFIEDKENNPCIYKGLPLHTEYRVFVDFDTKKVIGISPYWEPNTMKNRFGNSSDSDTIHNKHDYVIYTMHEETLMSKYKNNKEKIMNIVKELIQHIDNMTGQWSIDIMQNGNDFWFIDMALAQNSALIECVPKELRKIEEEDWIPELKG